MREIRLVGGIEAIHLTSGVLEVTFDGGQVVPFPVGDGAVSVAAAVVPITRRRGRPSKDDAAQETAAAEVQGDGVDA